MVSATENGGKIPIPPHMKMEQSVLVKSISVNKDHLSQHLYDEEDNCGPLNHSNDVHREIL